MHLVLQKARPTPVSVSTRQKLKGQVRRVMFLALFVLLAVFGHLPVGATSELSDFVGDPREIGCRVPYLICRWCA
jgi:hypothetical protein